MLSKKKKKHLSLIGDKGKLSKQKKLEQKSSNEHTIAAAALLKMPMLEHEKLSLDVDWIRRRLDQYRLRSWIKLFHWYNTR